MKGIPNNYIFFVTLTERKNKRSSGNWKCTEVTSNSNAIDRESRWSYGGGEQFANQHREKERERESIEMACSSAIDEEATSGGGVSGQLSDFFSQRSK